MEEPLRTVKDAAAFLQYHPRTVLLKVRTGEIPHVRLGRRSIRFRDSDLRAYLDAHARVSGGRGGSP